ncbi:MAG: SixA phosphatase family protein [Acidimicrobiia bacterium]
MTDWSIYVIRHADAGKRGVVADDRRALNERGRRQADGIARALRSDSIVRTVTSPFERCVQTIAPLAAALDTEVELLDDLGEGRGAAAALALTESAAETLALCSHGDVIGELLTMLDRRGVPLDDDRMAKGSTWVLSVVDGEVTAAHYLPPPADDAG